MLATSWPWAITTSGAREASAAAAPAAPAGKRKWAKTTSGRWRRAAAIALPVSRGYLTREPAAFADRDHLDLVPEPFELAADGDEEAAEVGIRGARPHLGHQQDAHGAADYHDLVAALRHSRMDEGRRQPLAPVATRA